MTIKHCLITVGCCIVGSVGILGLCGQYSGLLYLTSINVVTLWFYYHDKKQVINRDRRVAEPVLHVLALFGGIIGAMLGQVVFQH